MQNYKFFLSIAFLFVSSMASASPVDSKPISLIGQVKFQQRFTRVAPTQCGRAPCAQSHSYWSVVVESEGVTYLLNNKVGAGQARPPEYVEIAGTPVRPGVIVKIEGEGIPSSSKLFVLTQVKAVSLLMDLGWACHNSKTADPNMYVRLWYAPQGSSENGTFKIRVQQFTENAIYQIAFIDRAQFTTQDQGIAFVGTSPSANIELLPEPTYQLSSLKKFAALLRISQKHARANQKIDMQAEIEMDCSQTRFSPRDLSF